jgi:hypothetical protein
MQFKKLFLRHYLSASAFFLGWSLSAFVLFLFFSGTNQREASRGALTHAGVALVSSIGIFTLGDKARKDD